MLYILIIVVGGILSYFGPWWVIAPVCLVLSAWKAKDAKEAGLTAAAAAVTLWVGYATYLNVVAEVDLSAKIADLFTGGVGFLSKVPKVAFIFTIMTLIISAVSSFSGMAGVHIRQFFKA